MRYAEVAVDIPGDRARTFTYCVPDGMDATPGHAVWVPFGSRIRRGVIFALADSTDLDETRDVERLLDETPLISNPQLQVARWMAEYYRVGLFNAASQMLPPGFADTLRTYVSVTGEPVTAAEDIGQRGRRALEIARDAGRIRRDRLGRKLGRGGTLVVDRLVRIGLLEVETVWERPRTRPVYRSVVRLGVPAARADAGALRQRSAKRAALVRYLARHPGGVPRPDLVRQFGDSAVRGLVRNGLAALQREQMVRDPLRGRLFQTTFAHDPTQQQAAAIAAITDAIRKSAQPRTGLQGAQRFLLYGVTGSGKTEVYLRAAGACLAAGRKVIVLVPEIALTPQNLERFAGRFAGKIALLHSGLSAGERFDQWWAAKRGSYQIVLGSRSAVFAPLDDVGLIVIDEEHEWTYKQHDAAPRYHARAVAEKLCEVSGAVLVVGSATPDVETFRRCERGEYKLLELRTRIAVDGSLAGDRTAAGQASVQVVDMRRELRSGHTGLFCRALTQGIREALDADERVILFLNRRGAAAFVQCRACGHVRRCRRCDTTLTYHQGEGSREPAQLTCHYCNYRVRYTTACRECASRQLLPVGTGTQAIVGEVNRLFPGTGVVRWDRDVARTARAHAEILERFVKGPAQVLVGTQMVAKGLDIPDVTLVGVVSADTGLAIPDLRAGERAFQVLTQVAGRAGRGPHAGRTIIQTFQPDHYAIVAAAAQDFDAFYAVELEMRRRYANPPFTKLIRLGYSDPDAETARDAAMDLARTLRRVRAASGEAATEVIGPSPSYPARVRGLTRWHILLKGATPARLLDRVSLPRRWIVDVDPISVS